MVKEKRPGWRPQGRKSREQSGNRYLFFRVYFGMFRQAYIIGRFPLVLAV
nr:MAG TPA: hypothetical protein [Caudoviricetes sp.]